jgi:alpha-L-fucosidase
MRFAESKNLLDWKLLPEECVFTKERYSACPSIRHLDGWFYMTYLEALPGPSYETHIVRSKDLIRWESSPLNPVMVASENDKVIANPKLTDEQRKRIAGAVDRNNSDMDLCEFRGKTIITYSWGNQEGKEFLAGAVYEGSMASFLKGFFP